MFNFNKKRKQKTNEDRMHYYICYINEIIEGEQLLKLTREQKINGINKVNKILLSSIQQKIFEDTIKSKTPNNKDFSYYFFNTGITPNCYHCGNIPRVETTFTLENPLKVILNIDPLISFPWNRDRLTTLQYIGYRTNRPFKHDRLNHKMNYIFPVNIFSVYNGMHSSFAGLYDLSTFTYANQVRDISDFYNHFYFDGTHFRHYTCNKIIDTPDFSEFGILYELGRIYLDKNIDFFSYYELNSN